MPTFTTPILFIIFRRPDKARALVDSLRAVKPTRVFVSADGPRDGVPSDTSLCEETRRVVQEIDWECEVVTNFHEKNTGADFGPEKAINWFFENVEEGIILEDDCIAGPDFFSFAAEMLERYRNEPCVMHISGNNFQSGHIRGTASYYFSKYPSSWGWATWKRAWNLYNTELTTFSEIERNDTLSPLFNYKNEEKFWMRFFQKISRHELEHWDVKWLYAIWVSGGLCIIPNVNLVKNIGFGKDATHTLTHDDKMVIAPSTLKNITHPTEIAINQEADKFLYNQVYRFTLKKKLVHIFNLIKQAVK